MMMMMMMMIIIIIIIKSKDVPVLAMQAYGGNMGEAKVSVTLATLPPGKKPSTH